MLSILILSFCGGIPRGIPAPSAVTVRAWVAESQRAAACRCGDGCPLGGSCAACFCAAVCASPQPAFRPKAVVYPAPPVHFPAFVPAPLIHSPAPAYRAAPTFSFAPAFGASSCPGGRCPGR